jgi:hypothetical protein
MCVTPACTTQVQTLAVKGSYELGLKSTSQVVFAYYRPNCTAGSKVAFTARFKIGCGKAAVMAGGYHQESYGTMADVRVTTTSLIRPRRQRKKTYS